MRLEDWNPTQYDQLFEDVAMFRMEQAANIIKRKAKRNCPKGTVSRPIYKSGPYAGMPWTARDAGQLSKSIRVTRKLTPKTKALSKKRNVRVYAGHYLAYYSAIVEFYTPYMRPAWYTSLPRVKRMIGAT